MINELNHSLFAEDKTLFEGFSTLLSAQTAKKQTTLPFKDHHYFQILVDILGRKHTHHIKLFSDFPPLLRFYFLSAFTVYLQHEYIPLRLRFGDILYFDAQELLHTPTASFDQHFTILLNKLHHTSRYVLIAFSDESIFNQSTHIYFQRFQELLMHPMCRFIFFTTTKSQLTSYDFTDVKLPSPTQNDFLLILKEEAIALEKFHHVVIPELILKTALLLSQRYLSHAQAFAKALLLLDSAALRAQHIENNTPTNLPIITVNVLYEVIATWTQIPLAKIDLQPINLYEFIEQLQEKIFGQETAIQLLAQSLIQAQTALEKTTIPMATLHFTGPIHSGKRTTITFLAEQLFKHTLGLFVAEILPSHTSLLNLKFQQTKTKSTFTLSEAISAYPYAIIYLEVFDNITHPLEEELYQIFTTGMLSDERNQTHYFHQTIIIISTHIGNHLLVDSNNQSPTHEQSEELDLLQLITNSNLSNVKSSPLNIPNHVIDEIQLKTKLALPLIADFMPLIPFISLSKTALEKIIRLKLKNLSKLFDSKFGIELTYAPEIIRYLLNEAQLHSNKNTQIDLTLKPLYKVVEQAIFSQSDNKNRPNQLFVQLNETGQHLRCDWLTASPLKTYMPDV